MKKVFYFLIVILALVEVSCGKYLDQVPDDILKPEQIFDSKTNTDKFLANIYSTLPDEMEQRYTGSDNSGPWIAGSDESKYTWDFSYSNNLNSSVWTNTDGLVAQLWRNYYQAIRNATYLMQNIDKANPAEVDADMRKRYKEEARGLRAIFYFYLVRSYGPVVLLNNDIVDFEQPVDSYKFPRAPFDNCINYIATQLDSAASALPEKPVGDEYGRITSGICKAYKVEALLLAASPLFNGNNRYAPLKNNDGTALISQSVDVNKWKLAADAAKEFIDRFVPGTYDLYTESNSDPFMAAYLSCKNVVLSDWNKEWIFARSNSGNALQYERTPKHVGFPAEVQGGGAAGATQTMVDAYFMANGYPITDAASQYIDAGFSDFKAPFDNATRPTFNQWVNREPRFYVGITYNKSLWLNLQTNNPPIITVMEYSGNSGRVQSKSDVTPTGYIIRKNVGANDGARGALMLRLANIYLDYAEALNEYNPAHPDILKYLNLIRKRAGVPEFGGGAINPPTGQSSMREAIRRERRVELAFESVRYFDCHRWLIAEQTDNGPFYGMNLDADGNAFYQKTQLEVRKFQQRDYLWPIPNNEILKNENMVQNTGW